jgi:uncharacterized protein YegP (UPF0339 family)
LIVCTIRIHHLIYFFNRHTQLLIIAHLLLGRKNDYKTALGDRYTGIKDKSNIHIITESQLHSAAEKCENAIQEIHRPIIKSRTAISASIFTNLNETDSRIILDSRTYDHLNDIEELPESEKVEGYISSYNINTFKGRIYLPALGRPISFELSDSMRTVAIVNLITRSLAINAEKENLADALLECIVYKRQSRQKHLKGFKIVSIKKAK